MIVRVSIHARTGRATCQYRMEAAQNGFNSRAHGARDTALAMLAECPPTFQFTRARGARPDVKRALCDYIRFNSRAHGARDKVASPAVPNAPVSIHARTGRATLDSGAWRRPSPCFNSRAHGARDEPEGRT